MARAQDPDPAAKYLQQFLYEVVAGISRRARCPKDVYAQGDAS
jgi:hypothetical protein